MNCCSRSALGVVIGVLNIFIYIGVCIGIIFIYKDAQNKSAKFKIFIALILIVCLILVVITGLLVYGIYKRLHEFLWPWLVVNGVLFFCNCGRALFALILEIKNDTPFETCIWTLSIDILALCIQGLMYWPIYSLYKDIGRENRPSPQDQNVSSTLNMY